MPLYPASTVQVGSFNITSQSTTYSAAINDYILASGASFTITLPTAISQSGKQIIIQHNGTSLTNVYTLNTTSAQTIGGIASGSYALYTNGETLGLVSDGSNWQISNHKTITPVINAGALSITGSSVNPVKGTTSVDKFLWSREGSSMNFWYHYNQTAAGSGTAGTGDYSLVLTSGLTMDSSLITFNTTVYGLNSGDLQAMTIFGNGHLSSAGIPAVIYAATSSTMKLWLPSIGVWSAAEGALSNATLSIAFVGKVPISGWQP